MITIMMILFYTITIFVLFFHYSVNNTHHPWSQWSQLLSNERYQYQTIYQKFSKQISFFALSTTAFETTTKTLSLSSIFVEAFPIVSTSTTRSISTRSTVTIQTSPHFVSTSSLFSSTNEEMTKTSITTSSSINKVEVMNRRTIRQLQYNTRLPVWPIWSGIIITIIQSILGYEIGAKLENIWTGRVCPQFFIYNDTDPFIMLVHHCHSYHNWDIIRYIQNKIILPEGFPSHPHRGFITLTYILNGGFIHRDSLGIKQQYGNHGDDNENEKPHTQWLHTGSGILHEEMFDNDNIKKNQNNIISNLFSSQRQELYQIWLNVPSQYKMKQPYTVLLGNQNNETPIITTSTSHTKVIVGQYHNNNAVATSASLNYDTIDRCGIDVTILHVTLYGINTIWKYSIPEYYDTAMIYIRHSSTSLRVISNNEYDDNDDDERNTQIIPVHHTAYFTSNGNEIIVQTIHPNKNQNSNTLKNDNNDICDFLILAGKSIREPCVAQGSMVMNTNNEIQKAYIDYENGKFGIPWSNTLDDIDWRNHINNNKR